MEATVSAPSRLRVEGEQNRTLPHVLRSSRGAFSGLWSPNNSNVLES